MPERFLAMPESIACYEAILTRLRSAFPEAAVKVSRTQTALARGVQFAWLSVPRRRRDRGSVVLSFALPERVDSPRVFASAEPYPGRWMHHMLIGSPEELDGECLGWLAAAWAFGGRARG